VPQLAQTRAHPRLAGRACVEWHLDNFCGRYDAALICTDHDGVDYAGLVGAIDLVIDTRNATKDVTAGRGRIVLA